MQLTSIAGMSGVVLGGSHARGRARADSDVDIGLYYRAESPFSIDAISDVAASFNDTPNPIVSNFGEWGPWVDGGAWLTIEGHRVDLLYRSLDRVEDVLAAAQLGTYEIHYGQHPPFGFFSPTLLGETHNAISLHDPFEEIARIKEAVSLYPDPLREAVIRNCLWGVEFGLTAFAPKFAQTGNAYGVAGCLSRFTYYLTLALFAFNRAYLVNDKTALVEIMEFNDKPDRFAQRVQTVLAEIGSEPDMLFDSIRQISDIFDETVGLVGHLYERKLPN